MKDYTDIEDALPGYIAGGLTGIAVGAYTGVNPIATGAIFSSAAGATSLGKSLYKKELDTAKRKAIEEFSELF